MEADVETRVRARSLRSDDADIKNFFEIILRQTYSRPPGQERSFKKTGAARHVK